jgi:nucleoid DNA-binding protein
MPRDAKKLMNQKNYIKEHKKLTEMEFEEIKRELQESQISHLEEREKEKQEHLGTIRDDEQKPKTAFTTDEEMEIHQQREQIYKLKKNLKYVLSGDTNSN